MPVIDKAKIIEAIQQTDDEQVLQAINQLLKIEDEIPEWHKRELDKRTRLRQSGENEVYDWDDVKNEIKSVD